MIKGATVLNSVHDEKAANMLPSDYYENEVIAQTGEYFRKDLAALVE